MSILSPTPPASENAEIRFASLLVLIAAIALPTIATTEIKQPLAIATPEFQSGCPEWRSEYMPLSTMK